MPMPLFRRLYLFTITALLLLITVPVSAHDMTIGASRWCFGKNNVVATIELNYSLMKEIKGIMDGPYNLGANSDKQLQHVATDIIQPYINKKLSITVNDKAFPVKVDKIVRNESNLYTIWLSADNIRFNNPANPVKVDYRLLFAETDNKHVNVAYMYSSDATADTVQKIFDYSQPVAQYTFEHNAPTWEVSVKGVANEPPAGHKTASPAAAGSSESIEEGNKTTDSGQRNRVSAPVAVQKSIINTPALNDGPEKSATSRNAAAAMPEGTSGRQIPDNSSTVSSKNSTGSSLSAGKGNGLILNNSAKKSIWANIREFLVLGIEHILSGYDHIAFLLALIVIGLSVKEVLKIITAFTIAHSITLLLAAMQIINLNSRLVESVIAFSICYVALENLFRKKINYRWLVTFGFGLIHGFGFASALQELIVGKSDLVISVLSFNLGVEAGQIMIFLVMIPILYLLKDKLGSRRITAAASVAVFVVGFTWLIERVFDLKLLPL